MYVTNFVSKIDKKNVLRGVNFTNLKTPKIETSVGQFANDPNPRVDYEIIHDNNIIHNNNFTCTLVTPTH